MAPHQQINNYLTNQYEGMDPKQLILLLYKGAIHRLNLAMEGVIENDVKKRGENLGKTISIITELNASLDPTMKDESTEFLRGLYESILLELTRVSLTNDIETLKLTKKYVSKLKNIWENDVMSKNINPRVPGEPKYPVNQKPSGFTSIAI